MSKCALTTIDNPFDPFDQFDSWYAFDLDRSRVYGNKDCCSYLDRIARTSDQLTEEENDDEIERAIDEIIKYDFMNIYKKIKKE
jgi:hypothetical protein